jgi:hypothetical protein
MFSTNLQNKTTTIITLLIILVIIITFLGATTTRAVNNTKTYSTVQDFTTCVSTSPTLTDTVITEDDDGEIALKATLEDYFRTSEIVSPTWETGIYGGNPTISVVNGAARIVGSAGGGGYIQSQAPQYLGYLEAMVTFSAGQSQHYGWAAPAFSSDQYAIFSTQATTDKLFVRTNNVGSEIADLAADPLPSGPQRLRIEWLDLGTGNHEMRYYLNGVAIVTNQPHIVPAFPANALRIILSNNTAAQLALSADWIRYTHYTTTNSGSYTSCPISDAGNQIQIWGPVSWSPASPAAGSTISVGIQTSMNGTAWLPASPAIVSNGGTPAVPDGVYARYTVILTGTTAITDTPKLNSISLGYSSLPTISINDVSVTEGNAGTTNATFTVSLSAPRNQAVTVNYTTADGTATSASNDYTTTSGTVTFPANSVTPQTITVQVKGDTTIEPNETFVVNLSSPSEATIADSQGVGTIQNDDVPSTPAISINDVSVTEGNIGNTTATFNVTLSQISNQAVTVNYTTADNTATSASNDYTATSGTVTFPANNATPQTITVQVKGDTTVEPNETFVVNLSSPSGATIADSQGVGTIQNDDISSTPVISINDVSVAEGNIGNTTATFNVTLSQISNQAVTVDYSTANGTATTPNDYSSISATELSFPPGTTTQTITVQIAGDTLVENDETFLVNLSNPSSGVTIADNQGIGTITNDDSASISITDASVTEGNGGSISATFTVSLSAPSSQTITVDYATSNGSATSPTDYNVIPNTQLTFPAGTTTQTIVVHVKGDTLVETDETFSVNLSAPSGATLADSQGIGTIENDDDGLHVYLALIMQ